MMKRTCLLFCGVVFAAAAVAADDGITRARYPDADAVVVDDTEEIVYRPDGTARTVETQRTRVLTEKGRREERVITVGYSARYGRARIADVRIVGTNGVERAVDVSATTKESTDNGGMAMNIVDPLDRKIVCTVPGLEVGETLVTRVERETTAARVENTWADVSVLEWTSPMVRASVRVTSPAERPLRRFKLRHPLGNVVFSAETNDAGIVRTWTATNSPQAFPEPDMPPLHTQVQALVLSTAADWREISSWYWNLSKPHVEKTTAEMTNLVETLLEDVAARGGKTETDRIRALYKFVSQEVRYMGLTLEDKSPGYAPHDVSLTFENRYGVCRDKAALLVALLRLAGVEAYPTLIQVGAKQDPDVPVPYFNHAIVAVPRPGAARTDPAPYLLMDPTNESSRDLMPAYLGNCSYLVARPEGDVLRTAPVAPAERNAVKIDAEGALEPDGSVLLEQRLAFDGINDNAFRGGLLRRRPEDRRKLFEKMLRSRFAGVELLRCDITPDDLRDTDEPLRVTLVSRLPGRVLAGETRDVLDVPLAGAAFGVVNWLLEGKTSLEKRRYPLVLDTTASVDETLKLKLGDALGEALSLPDELRLDGAYAFARDAYVSDGTLVCRRNLSANGVEFAPADYLALRERLKEIEAAERDRPVFAVNRLANANLHVLLDRDDLVRAGPRAWSLTNTVVKRILTYDGKKRNSELKFAYNPTWQRVSLLYATVSNADGRVTRVTPKEVNVLDCGWAAAAPRYPASKMLVVNLPSVEIGSVLSYATVETATDAPAPFYGVEYFDSVEPAEELALAVDGRVVRRARPAKRIAAEGLGAPGVLWREREILSEGRFGDVLPDLARAADVAPAASDFSTVREIRDWMAKNVRVAGPTLYELPVAAQLTPPDTVVAERYATRLDYVRTLCALLKGAGFDADIVFAADDASSDPLFRRLARETGNVRAWCHALCRVRVREGDFLGFGGTVHTYFLGTENEYAPLGTTAFDGASFLDPADGSFGVVAADGEALRDAQRTRTTVTLRENGAADVDVAEETFGAPVAGFRKRYAEILPEERSRLYQAILGEIAQSASATRELLTDTEGYPATRTFSCFVPDYATSRDGMLTLVLPEFDQTLFPLEGGVRRNPIGVRAEDPSETVVEVVFPEGFTEVEHLPAPYAVRDPRHPGDLWLANATDVARRDGRLVVTVSRRVFRHADAMLGADLAAHLRDLSRNAASSANRTLVVRRARKP